MRRSAASIRHPLIALWPVIIVATLGLAGCALGSPSSPPTSGQATITSQQTVEQKISALTGVIQVDAATNQIRYTTRDVTLVAVGAPPGHEGEYWQVDGRVNPTVIVPAGAHLTVDVINGDPDMPHGWLLTPSAPPYGRMPMMGGMYGGAGMYAATAPLPVAHSDQWPMATLNFTAPPSGVYYYICQVQDHAREGMWGKLIVE